MTRSVHCPNPFTSTLPLTSLVSHRDPSYHFPDLLFLSIREFFNIFIIFVHLYKYDTLYIDNHPYSHIPFTPRTVDRHINPLTVHLYTLPLILKRQMVVFKPPISSVQNRIS